MYVKTLISLVAAVPATVAVELLSYVYQDWEFAKWIAIAIVIDTAASIVKHFIYKDISSDEFWKKFSKKIFVYILLLILSNILSNYTVQGHKVGATDWISEYLCVYMIIREAISILENLNAIIPIVPAWLLKRLKDFNEKGEYIHKKKDCDEEDDDKQSGQEPDQAV
ncbi:MAG: bacteriophage holin [Prevotella sp.]|nr:bacteriophage holin [Prevotella sp.]